MVFYGCSTEQKPEVFRLLSWQKSLKAKNCPTKRAPDAGDSAAISSSFPRLSLFLAGRLRRPRPSAGNANRWAAISMSKIL